MRISLIVLGILLESPACCVLEASFGLHFGEMVAQALLSPAILLVIHRSINLGLSVAHLAWLYLGLTGWGIIRSSWGSTAMILIFLLEHYLHLVSCIVRCTDSRLNNLISSISYHHYLLFEGRSSPNSLDSLVRIYLFLHNFRALETCRDLLRGKHAACLRDHRGLDPLCIWICHRKRNDLLIRILPLIGDTFWLQRLI